MRKTTSTLLALGISASSAACVLPGGDPTILFPCGERWGVQTTGAEGWDGQNFILILVDGDPVQADSCLTETVAEDATDDQSAIYASLQNAAIAACEAEAAAQTLTLNDCDENAGTPFYDDDCHMDVEECDPEAEGTGDDDGFGDISPDVDCTSPPAGPPVCTLSLSLVAELRTAPTDTWLADGTELDLVSGRAGPIGWEFSGIVSGSVADELGFQNGDIAKDIDGIALTSFAALLEAADYAQGEEAVTVEYKRGSSTYEVIIEKEPPT